MLFESESYVLRKCFLRGLQLYFLAWSPPHYRMFLDYSRPQNTDCNWNFSPLPSCEMLRPELIDNSMIIRGQTLWATLINIDCCSVGMWVSLCGNVTSDQLHSWRVPETVPRIQTSADICLFFYLLPDSAPRRGCGEVSLCVVSSRRSCAPGVSIPGGRRLLNYKLGWRGDDGWPQGDPGPIFSICPPSPNTLHPRMAWGWMRVSGDTSLSVFALLPCSPSCYALVLITFFPLFFPTSAWRVKENALHMLSRLNKDIEALGWISFIGSSLLVVTTGSYVCTASCRIWSICNIDCHYGLVLPLS